ncbi:hypothetical protein Bpfe_012496 [Biomphalaria pfeifferi]|uniref:Uncharacterized protein n=1 Tax=Biomphalaria pfeifferi TaxID=112525 RepID=A0AAD8FAV4_BIOPF|nr:hypothetical protein Bpfe_012496 [Biomphalaria pfeifferi]
MNLTIGDRKNAVTTDDGSTPIFPNLVSPLEEGWNHSTILFHSNYNVYSDCRSSDRFRPTTSLVSSLVSIKEEKKSLVALGQT